MPKSKRNKEITLTQTSKKGREGKNVLFGQIQKCCDEYEFLYVLKVENMRNLFMKEIRGQFNDSRFFFGSNRVMAKALGQTEQEEYVKGASKISLKGNVGILFTNVQVKEESFATFSDYARGGGLATREVVLPKGPLIRDEVPLPPTMEPMFRKLGLPTELQKGVIHLREEHVVCKEGSTLTPEQANILKQFGIEMAEFKIILLSVLNLKTGDYTDLI